MAYPRNCIHCGQLIVMSELSPGRWQPWEPDGMGRHLCGSGRDKSGSPLLSTLVSKAETYLTRCPWCRQHVHYHTNGHGDCVYFNSLGYPWQIHACWEKYWKEKKDRQRVLNQFLNQDTLDQQKLLILAGVLRTAKSTGSQNSLLYAIHEATLAQRLGISVPILQTNYGHLYKVEAHGIKLKVGSSTPTVSIEPDIKLDLPVREVRSKLVDCKHCGKVVWENRLIDHLKASHPLATFPCPNCNKVIPKRSLQKHLEDCKPKKKRKKRKRSRIVR